MDVVRDADVLPTGARAGNWRIEYELGRGGMSVVYAVVHEQIRKRAALKVMHRHLAALPAASGRVVQEALLVNAVSHPNIVDIFESGFLDDGRPYLIMERLEGRSLSTVASKTRLPPDRVIQILLELCDALSAAHAHGVVHRDLKLDNIFLVDNPSEPDRPRVKLLDWGIAKLADDDRQVTQSGELVGTPDYLAPEQARGGAVGPQTDVYSLGVIAYELLLGSRPFEAESVAEVLMMHLTTPPPAPRDVWPDIPRGLEALLIAMLEKEASDRPSIYTVGTRLQVALAEIARRRHDTAALSVALAKSSPRYVRRSRWSRPKLAGVLGLVVAIAGIDVARRLHGAAAADDPSAVAPPTKVVDFIPKLPPVAMAEVPATALVTRLQATPQHLDAFDAVERTTQPPKPTANPSVTSRPTMTVKALSPKPAVRLSRVRSTPPPRSATAPTAQPSVATKARAASPSAAEVAARYQSVGRALKELQQLRGSAATNDLWPRFRLIQLNDAISTDRRREAAMTSLGELQDELSMRL